MPSAWSRCGRRRRAPRAYLRFQGPTGRAFRGRCIASRPYRPGFARRLATTCSDESWAPLATQTLQRRDPRPSSHLCDVASTERLSVRSPRARGYFVRAPESVGEV